VNEQEAREGILSGVRVHRQFVAIAKSFIVSCLPRSCTEIPKQDSLQLLKHMLEHLGVQTPQQIIIHRTVDIEPQLKQVAQLLSWQLAFAEALWGLIGAGLLLPAGSETVPLKVGQAWTTVVPGSGGHSSGWSFEEAGAAVPRWVQIAPSYVEQPLQPLSDADLFIKELDAPNMPSEIEEALRESVRCFQHELYLPSLALLGLASEGSWIELGLSLLKACPGKPGLTSDTRRKKRSELTDHYTSVLKKMEIVAELYGRRDVYREVAARSGYSHRSLAEVLNWSNVLRDARNAIHYGTRPASPNTYEKVAALLLGAAQNLRIIYSIVGAAEELQ
jgi:hypothetical protein